jgi:XTP/dITP diphosphohydrolase
MQDKNEIENEFGDVLFSLINMARHLKIDPEMALQKTNNKFKKRFEFIEDHAEKPLNEMSLNEMDILWNQAKTI